LEQTVTGHLRWVPPRIDMNLPHPARMHDYWLGGGHNLPADRELAEKIMRLMPGIEDMARLNQAFLRRAALFMVEEGVRQFLDIGSGLPNVGHLHEIVQPAASGCTVVYVDSDPVAVAHSELMLAGTERTAVLQANMRDVAGIFNADATREMLDLSQPIGLLAPMLHFIPDSWHPAGILAQYRDRLASGSWMAILHVTADSEAPGLAETVDAYAATRFQLFPRSHAEVLRICDGFELVEPGLVGFGLWRPDGPGDQSTHPGINSLMYAAVGRKP
jgi:hypothetical protein